ncbi:MAG: protein-disulfide reductase DsbD domain-containing protein [Methyloceanibacter sp.]
MNGSLFRDGIILAVGFLACSLYGPRAALADQYLNSPARPVGSTSPTSDFADSAAHVHIVGVTRARADDDELVVTLRIDPGFHVNANPASFENLIPTSLAFTGAVPIRITYPQPVSFKPKFLDEPLDVYEGTIAVEAFFPKGAFNPSARLGATVTVQACTDVICLPPADLPVPEN